MKTFIIAEAGVNHNGRFDLALKLIDAAVQAGADAVKFQTFKAENLVLKSTPKAEYQKKTTTPTESQYDMLRQLELSFDEFTALKQYCDKVGIEFMSTGFDTGSVQFLQSLELKRYKIPSGELTNSPLVYAVAAARKPIILSTGMASLGDIEFALAVIHFALTQDTTPTSKDDILRCYSSSEQRSVLADYVTLLHCTSSYPTEAKYVNLNAIHSLACGFGLNVGFSDHSLGLNASLAAVAKGATVIEKHFTLDKALPGPDHGASLDTEELTRFISQIRQLEIMLGDGRKVPQVSELENQRIARQRLVALKPIKKGEVVTAQLLGTRRAVEGLTAELYWDLLGKTSTCDYAELEPICELPRNR